VKSGASSAPTARCSMHERARIDRRSGLLAARGCGDVEVEERSFERFPAEFSAWARSAVRTMAPEAYSPRCPRAAGDAAAPSARVESGRRGKVQIRYPPDGAVFTLDPGAIARQAIQIQVDVPPGVAEIRLLIDGQARPVGAPFNVDLPLSPGAHWIRAEADGAMSEVGFEVH
jgi:hypothetical protein